MASESLGQHIAPIKRARRFVRLAALIGFWWTTLATAPQPAQAQTGLTDRDLKVGIGVASINALGKTTKSEDGATASLGAYAFPLLVRYDFYLDEAWFIAPQIAYTPIGRKSAGDATSTTSLQLFVPAGSRLFALGSETWLDWQAGLGFTRSTIAGAGGTETLNNGTSTTTFAKPGGTSVTTVGLVDLGLAVNFGSHRIGFDAYFEGLLSSKRSANLMLTYFYGIW